MAVLNRSDEECVQEGEEDYNRREVRSERVRTHNASVEAGYNTKWRD